MPAKSQNLADSGTLQLTESAALLLGRRHRTQPDNLLDAVFPTRNATRQQVNNVERRWRQIRRDGGLDWITPDLFRRVTPGEPVHERRLGRPDA